MNALKSAGKRVLSFPTRDPILFAAVISAVASAFFVPPSKEYLSYLDYRVLCLLLALMLVVAGLQKAGVFTVLIRELLKKVHNTRSLSAVLIGICFFASMLITNDVALITFVPLSLLILTQTGKQKLLIPVICLQTIAANLGSMLTPLGNPQNLYLYSLSDMSIGQFLTTMALPSAVSLLLLVGSLAFIKREPVSASSDTSVKPMGRFGVIMWVALFSVCLLAVVRIIPYYIALAVVIAAALITDRKLLLRADYSLLLTFTFLFIFIGNMKSIPAVSTTLSSIVNGRELSVGILLSQIISNVPAAMLLSGFTANLSELLIGVNLGGLGTLIASMASLISYKLYCVSEGARRSRYLLVFTALNLLFLGVLWAFMLLV